MSVHDTRVCTQPPSSALQIKPNNFSVDTARAHNMQLMVTLCIYTHGGRTGNTWPAVTIIHIMVKYFGNMFYTKLGLLFHAHEDSTTVSIQCHEPWLRFRYCSHRLRVTVLRDSWQNSDFVNTSKTFSLAH